MRKVADVNGDGMIDFEEYNRGFNRAGSKATTSDIS